MRSCRMPSLCHHTDSVDNPATPRDENGEPLSLRIASGSPYSSKMRCMARLTVFVRVLGSATIAMMKRLCESVIVSG